MEKNKVKVSINEKTTEIDLEKPRADKLEKYVKKLMEPEKEKKIKEKCVDCKKCAVHEPKPKIEKPRAEKVEKPKVEKKEKVEKVEKPKKTK